MLITIKLRTFILCSSLFVVLFCIELKITFKLQFFAMNCGRQIFSIYINCIGSLARHLTRTNQTRRDMPKIVVGTLQMESLVNCLNPLTAGIWTFSFALIHMLTNTAVYNAVHNAQICKQHVFPSDDYVAPDEQHCIC